MARTTAKERLARREYALALFADGNSFRTVAALVLSTGFLRDCPTGLDLGQKQTGRGTEFDRS